MLFYVVECFTVNLENLPANPVREPANPPNPPVNPAPAPIRSGSARANPLIKSTKSADCTRSGRRSVTMCRNSAPSFRTVCCSEVKPVSNCSGCDGHLAPQHIQLDLDAQQRLQNSVVQIARNSRPFRLDRAHPQVPQQKYVLQRRAHVPRRSSQTTPDSSLLNGCCLHAGSPGTAAPPGALPDRMPPSENSCIRNSCSVGPGIRGRIFSLCMFRRSQPNPDRRVLPANSSTATLPCRPAEIRPSASAAGCPASCRSLSPDFNCHRKMRSRSASR